MTKSAQPSHPPASRGEPGPARASAATPPAAAEPAPADGTSSPSSEYLQQLMAPWTAMAGMWNAWLQTTEVVSRERGVESTKLFNRLWDPELWRAGRLAELRPLAAQVVGRHARPDGGGAAIRGRLDPALAADLPQLPGRNHAARRSRQGGEDARGSTRSLEQRRRSHLYGVQSVRRLRALAAALAARTHRVSAGHAQAG